MSEQSYWARTAGRRLSRRGVLRGSAVAGLGLAGAALIGCGDDDDDEAPAAQAPAPATGGTAAPSGAATETAAPAGGPIDGGIFNSGRDRSVKGHYDPHINLNDHLAFWTFIGNHGTDMTQDGSEIIPELLESWEIPGDGTEMIAKVRSTAKWHNKPPVNGRALDAEDAVFNLLDIAAILRPERAAEFHSRSVLAGLEDAEAIDEQTLRIKFEHPVSTFLAGLGHFRSQWSPRDFESAGGDYTDGESLVGTGPFVVDEFVPDQKMVFSKNQEYWKPGQPHFDGHRWVWLPDATSQATAFAQGDINVISGTNKVVRETVLKLAKDAQERRWDFPSWIHIRFNPTRKPFDDVRVRRAIFLVPDWHRMMDEHFGEGFWNPSGALASAYPEAIQPDELRAMPGYRQDTAGKEADIQEAVALMTAAGFPDGDITFGITHYASSSSAYFQNNAIRAQADLSRVWPKMTAELDQTPDTPSFGKRQAGNDFDTISYTIHGVPDGVLELISDYATQGGLRGGRNYGKWSDPTTDDLLDQAIKELDIEARSVIARKAQDHLIEQMPTMGFGSDRGVRFFTANVRNWEVIGSRVYAGSRAVDSYFDQMWFDEA